MIPLKEDLSSGSILDMGHSGRNWTSGMLPRSGGVHLSDPDIGNLREPILQNSVLREALSSTTSTQELGPVLDSLPGRDNSDNLPRTEQPRVSNDSISHVPKVAKIARKSPKNRKAKKVKGAS